MKTQTSIERILEMAETTLAQLAIEKHRELYTKLIVHFDDKGVIDNAFITDDNNEYDCRQNDWHMLLCVGTGSCKCNCDACVEGDDPEDWAGDEADQIEEEIERNLTELESRLDRIEAL